MKEWDKALNRAQITWRERSLRFHDPWFQKINTAAKQFSRPRKPAGPKAGQTEDMVGGSRPSSNNVANTKQSIP